MKAVVLITMILAVMAPVLAQQSKFKLWECETCKTQRQSQFEPPRSAGDGGCVSARGQKFNNHIWRTKR